MWLTQAIDLHDHSDHDHGHSHDISDITIEPYLWKMLAATVTVWIFFDLQIVLQWVTTTISRRRNKVS